MTTNNLIQVATYKRTYDLLGKSIRVFLRDGGDFHFKVTGASETSIDGYDEERLNLTIDTKDIEYIIDRSLDYERENY
ncbi:hypothetical protein NYE67_20705 [Solibacillus sp. FSL W8-0474]|uniref:hypothetical protein n=1 Tax=Solibacillus sp. FSL W8-0474 TaxID=2975336 RepID=UPI0030FAA818